MLSRESVSSSSVCCLLLLDRDTDDGDVVVWFVGLGISFDIGHLLDDLHSLRDPAKDGVLPVQPWLQTHRSFRDNDVKINAR